MTDKLVDKDDLRDLRDQLTDEIRSGFKGVHDRQDKTNGRIGDVEKVQAAHVVKIDGLQRELYRRRASRRDGDPTPPDEAPRGISQRDVTVAVGAVGGGWAIIKGLAWLVPFLK